MSEPTRSGFIGLVGRPNAGKSTFINRVIGEKIAIVSDKPQTTRREIRGVLTRGNEQMVLTDLPGMQKPRDTMTGRMQSRAMQSAVDCDAVLFLLNGEQAIGAGDDYIARMLTKSGRPVITAVNKIDRLSRAKTLDALEAAAVLAPGEVYPLSAMTGEGADAVIEALFKLLPEGPFMFDPQTSTDQPEKTRLAELVREQILLRTRNELPHAVEVEVEEIEEVERDSGTLTIVRARLLAETDSQKRILVGKGGKMIKAVGVAARPGIEIVVGHQVHLELQVIVRKHWRRDDAILDRLGIG